MSHKISTTSQNHNKNSSGFFNQQNTVTSGNSNLFKQLNFGLRRLFKLPLDFYSCMVSSGKLSLRRSRTLQISALVSSFALILAISAILAPLYNRTDITEAATGTAATSSLTMNVTNAIASVDLSVLKDNGSFASSTNPIALNIATTNYSGYTLSIKNTKSATTLVNSTNNNYTLSSITSSVTESAFSADTTSAATNYNGKWGYKPSKYNSSSNSNYLSLPATGGSTLDTTTAANSSANSYTIGIGARASYTQPAGTYTGTYTLTAVGNAITYYLSFADNTSDSTVSGLPNAMSSSISTTSVTLPTTTPTRTGYTFKSWCLGTVNNSGTTCTGTEYAKGASFGMDQTSSNGTSTAPTTLYTTWTINSYTQTVEYYCQSATGAASSKYTYTQSVNYGSTFTFTSSNATSCYNSTYHNSTIYTANNGTTSKTISYKVAGTSTNTAYFNRNTRTVTLTKGTGISTVSVTGTGVKSGSGTASATVYYGGAVTITATMTSGYDWVNWTGSATYTNQSQSISSVTSNLSFTGNGKVSLPSQSLQTTTSSTCTTTVKEVYDTRDEQIYHIQKLADNKCWLLDNLALGAVTLKQTLSTNNTNMDSNIAFTMPSSISKGFGSDTAAQINTASNTKTGSGGYAAGKYGVYYNYCAASAGTYCMGSGYGVNDANYDICPKGWRMPTGGSSGEYQALYAAHNSDYSAFINALHIPFSGYFYFQSANRQGSKGIFWSSTYSGANDILYDLEVDGSTVNPKSSDARIFGHSMRCILR